MSLGIVQQKKLKYKKNKIEHSTAFVLF
jgi:hypothetical protein